ncbi:MAG TPA: hypothetical protein PLV68_06575, partial [Ilumatobacteraceae bacterium]|nr:hypothetical protein [Ilumatobacteraceae bacterium]
PQRTVPTRTTCEKIADAFAEDEEKRPYGVVTTQATTTTPEWFSDPARDEKIRFGVYPGGTAIQTDTALWYRDHGSLARLKGTIWTPNLPVHALSTRLPFADPMPSGFGDCQVFFPGTYTQPVTISSAIPTYFTSGIYYFEQPVTITGDANVVVGGGSVEGCTTDQEAAFYATNAPSTHNITGLGGTFVFGYQGRLIVDNSVPSTTGNGVSLVFNQRYVHPDDVNSLPSASVNVMSVNGALAGSDLSNPLTDLLVAGVVEVPKSLAPTTPDESGTVAFADATLNKYRPSVLIPPDLPPPPEPPEPEDPENPPTETTEPPV